MSAKRKKGNHIQYISVYRTIYAMRNGVRTKHSNWGHICIAMYAQWNVISRYIIYYIYIYEYIYSISWETKDGRLHISFSACSWTAYRSESTPQALVRISPPNAPTNRLKLMLIYENIRGMSVRADMMIWLRKCCTNASTVYQWASNSIEQSSPESSLSRFRCS